MIERWAIIALLVAAFGGASFVAGVLHAEKQAVREDVRILTKEKKVIQYVAREDNKRTALFEAERDAIRNEFNGLRREYDSLRKELDARDGQCDLPAPVVRMLDRARAASGSSASALQPPAAVPAAAPAP